MKFAVVGGGVSGLTAAYLLSQKYPVTLYEAAAKLGGHTHTVDVERAGGAYPVDMGFIVFNEKNYPGFVRLLDRLGVSSSPSDMSFGVSSESSGIEYCASDLGSFFAQKRNLGNLSHLRMMFDILKFRRKARRLLDTGDTGPSLGEFLREGGFTERFKQEFIVPMGAAVWSADPEGMHRFPARYLIQFFENHRFLDAGEQLPWRTVRGGSRTYVERLASELGDSVRLGSPVSAVRRLDSHVEVVSNGTAERYDHVVLCSHSDQTLAMLDDPSEAEREILGAIPYQPNDTVLHTDASVMPETRKAWASWNVRVNEPATSGVRVTYHSNRLQGLDAPEEFLVTLNRTGEIDPRHVIEQQDFAHPVYTFEGLRAQDRRDEISGHNRTSYAGAYWGFGFHEDGVQSAVSATRPFGVEL